jgi:hypothetical protein
MKTRTSRRSSESPKAISAPGPARFSADRPATRRIERQRVAGVRQAMPLLRPNRPGLAIVYDPGRGQRLDGRRTQPRETRRQAAQLWAWTPGRAALVVLHLQEEV